MAELGCVPTSLRAELGPAFCQLVVGGSIPALGSAVGKQRRALSSFPPKAAFCVQPPPPTRLLGLRGVCLSSWDGEEGSPGE